MRHERRVVGVIHLDRNEPHVLDVVGQEVESTAVGGVVALHVGDLGDPAGAIARRGDFVAAAGSECERLFAQHVRSGLERLDRKLRMEGIGGGNDHGIQRAGKKAVDVFVQLLKIVTGAQAGANRRRGVGQPDEVEAIAFLPEIECVFGLSHETRPDQSHAQSRHPNSLVGTIQVVS